MTDLIEADVCIVSVGHAGLTATWRLQHAGRSVVVLEARERFGRVHWAGTETATVSHGAIDGAVRSGERAAAEILASA